MMNNGRFALTLIMMGFVFDQSSIVVATDVAKGCIVYKVVDELGKPIGNANLRASGWVPDQSVSANMSVSTDSNGIAVVELHTALDMGGTIEKKDFYISKFYHMFHSLEAEVINGHWQPWGITNTVVLKKKNNPIPMYAKHVDDLVPVLDQLVGYDLEFGDWVMPYGVGSTTDLLFFVSGQYTDGFRRDLKMEMIFNGLHDGIKLYSVPVHKEQTKGSFLISAYQAPITGYASKYLYVYQMRKEQSDRINTSPRWGQNAYLRTRTMVDDDNQIIESNYGKIYGDIICYFRNPNEIYVKFTYYWNPEINDRNVEFDFRRNLFKWTYRNTLQESFSP